MRKIAVCNIALLLLLLFELNIQAHADNFASKLLPASLTSSTPLNIQQAPHEIRIIAAEAKMDDALEQIRQETNIQFLVSETIKNEIISGNFIAPDWYTIVDALLADFNCIKIWDNDKKLQKVMVISVKSPSAALGSLPQESTSLSTTAPKSIVAAGEQSSPLQKQLFESETPVAEQPVEYSTRFSFEGGISPSSDEVQRFHDQNPPLSPEDIAKGEAE